MIQTTLDYAVELLILVFLTITFLQSGLDKLFDWNGNKTYINSVFKNTFLKSTSSLLFIVIVVSEIIAGILSIIGVFQIYLHQTKTIGYLATIISAKTLLALLFGQRVAKDYAGAMTIAVYFAATIFGVYVFSLN
jgi:hypothetical protein